MRCALAGLGPSGTNAALAAQMSQLFSERNNLARIAAVYTPRSAILEAVSTAGLSAQIALVAAQAAQIVSAQDSLARLVATAGVSASMDGLFDSVTRYGQVQEHLSAFAVDVEAPVMLSRVGGWRGGVDRR